MEGLPTVKIVNKFFFPAGLRNFREQVQHISRAGPSSFHGSRRSGDNAALPGPKMQQAYRLRSLAHPRQVGDGAHRHHHEAQARRRPVWRGLCGCLEEIQPHSCCQNTQGLSHLLNLYITSDYICILLLYRQQLFIIGRHYGSGGVSERGCSHERSETSQSSAAAWLVFITSAISYFHL